MPQVTVQLYRIPIGYLTGPSGTVQQQITVTITDDDAFLDTNELGDPGSSQVFTSSAGTITDYTMVFNTTFQWYPPGSSTAVTVSAKVMQLTINGQNAYYLMSTSGSSIPDLSVGALIYRLTRTGYTPVNYADIACFAAGTLISTPTGPRAVEDIRLGDLILTEDHGARPVRWIGEAHLGAADLALCPELRPIRVERDAFGPGLPETDLFLSPQHRVLLTGWRVELFFGEDEALAPVKHLLSWPGVEIATDHHSVTYFHLMFNDHEIIRANGLPAESFYLGDRIREGLGEDRVREILALFPELAAHPPRPARAFAKAYEVAAIGALN